jgi:hypothetical protein
VGLHKPIDLILSSVVEWSQTPRPKADRRNSSGETRLFVADCGCFAGTTGNLINGDLPRNGFASKEAAPWNSPHVLPETNYCQPGRWSICDSASDGSRRATI